MCLTGSPGTILSELSQGRLALEYTLSPFDDKEYTTRIYTNESAPMDTASDAQRKQGIVLLDVDSKRNEPDIHRASLALPANGSGSERNLGAARPVSNETPGAGFSGGRIVAGGILHS